MEKIERLKLFAEGIKKGEIDIGVFKQYFKLWDFVETGSNSKIYNIEGFAIEFRFRVDLENDRCFFEVIGNRLDLTNRLYSIISVMEKNIIKDKVKLESEEIITRKRL